MSQLSAIQTGDWVGSRLKGPEWTPYAEAIASHYPIQVPWFYTLPVSLVKTGTTVPMLTQVTKPHLYDVLILGVSATVRVAGLIQQIWVYLNVTHQETGIPWAVPGRIDYFPLGALAGVAQGNLGTDPFMQATSVLKLPEAFFLPKHTQLKLDWTFLNAAQPGPQTFEMRLTFCGVQLINHSAGFRTPQRIAMPGGNEIEVGSRLPWFATVPVGEYQTFSIDDFQLNPGRQVAQFLPAQDCEVEIHDLFSNFISTFAPSTTGIVTKLTDMDSQKYWTPTFAPIQAVFGQEIQVEPGMPFTKPYLLQRGHRMQSAIQNNFAAITVDAGTVTFRGVRRCEY